MKASLAVLAALAAAVTLASVAAAGPDAAKQRVAITSKILPNGEFVFTPLQAGALKRDSGTMSGNWESVPSHFVMREGQKVEVFDHPVVWTFLGKRGSLTIRERSEWVYLGNDGNGDGVEDAVAFGTWKVVRATGQYAQLAGGGRSGHAGLGREWFARYEGFVTLP